MKTDHVYPFVVWCSVVVLAGSAGTVCGQPSSTARNVPTKVGSVPVAEVLQRLGAKLEEGASSDLLENYINHFDRTDPNRDGKHTREEYVEKGRYMTPQARAGIFRASDGNGDGVVTRNEYVLNRIVTDEAKIIVQEMDDDQNGLVEREEFVRHATKLLADAELAGQVFSALDINADGELPVPEYLQVWGKWARTGRKPAAERIAARQAEVRKTSDSKSLPPRARQPGGEPSGRPGGPPDVDEIFKRFDGNRDGKLQKQEIPEFVQQFILPADANQDGAVTKSELQTARQRQVGRPGGNSPRTPERESATGKPGSNRAGNRSKRSPGPGQQGASSRNRERTARQFVERAMQFDADKDGKLDRQELLKLAEDQSRRTKTESRPHQPAP
jgi:Ca2+-binding EF-hand superfamily protein